MKKSLTRNIVGRLLRTAAMVALIGGALTLPANALTRIEIDDTTATTSIPTLEVPRGHSVVLTLDNGQYIQAIWVDDPSILGIATDRPLCSGGTSAQNCGSASVVRLTSLGGSIDLPGASFGQGNGTATVITLITTDAGGTNRKTYQFTVNAITGRSDVSHVTITPTITTSPSSTQPRGNIQAFREIESFDIDAVRAGRDIVLANGRANTNSIAWRNLEFFLSLLEQNQDVESAATNSGVNRALLVELERTGLSSAEVSAI